MGQGSLFWMMYPASDVPAWWRQSSGFVRRTWTKKHTNAAECCQSYVVGSETAKVFVEGKENVLRIYLRIRHTTVNGVESL